MKLTVNVTRVHMKNAALAQAGIPGAALGHRKSSQRHASKKALQQRGRDKHKLRSFDS